MLEGFALYPIDCVFLSWGIWNRRRRFVSFLREGDREMKFADLGLNYGSAGFIIWTKDYFNNYTALDFFLCIENNIIYREIMMKRRICVTASELNLLFARESDRRLIYDMSVKDTQIILSMFDKPADFRWEEFRDEKKEFFDEQPSLNKYLLIEYNNEIIGVFCHVHHPAHIVNMEFHIWFVSTKYTGRGFGPKVVQMMKEYINKSYQIDTFMMRPWIKNPRAIRSYEKCGFEVKAAFDLTLFFTAEEIAKHGNGAYCVEETVNMIAVLADK